MPRYWIALLLKELRLARMLLLADLAVLVAGSLFVLLISGRGTAGTTAGMALYAIHMAFPAVYLLYSLVLEDRLTRRMWLHNPHTALALFSVKWLVAFAWLVLALFISGHVTLTAARVELNTLPITWSGVNSYARLMGMMAVALAVYGAAWSGLLWSAVDATRTRWRFARWPIAGLLLALFYATLSLRLLPAYAALIRWGRVRIPLPALENPIPGFAALLPISLGETLFYLASVAAFVAITLWLVDRKLEV